MMWSWEGSGWDWVWMSLVMVAFWALIAAAVYALIRSFANDSSRTGGATAQRTPESILAERFARGEIDADEYHSRLNDLRTPVG